LVILQTKPEHSGTFECLVRNSAGESRKKFDLAVWGLYFKKKLL
jgi:hypothetical protein